MKQTTVLIYNKTESSVLWNYETQISKEMPKESLTKNAVACTVISKPMLEHESELWRLTEKPLRMEAAEIRFLRAVAGYRMTDHRRNQEWRRTSGMNNSRPVSRILKIYRITKISGSNA
jgi:hypothetical protein